MVRALVTPVSPPLLHANHLKELSVLSAPAFVRSLWHSCAALSSSLSHFCRQAVDAEYFKQPCVRLPPPCKATKEHVGGSEELRNLASRDYGQMDVDVAKGHFAFNLNAGHD